MVEGLEDRVERAEAAQEAMAVQLEAALAEGALTGRLTPRPGLSLDPELVEHLELSSAEMAASSKKADAEDKAADEEDEEADEEEGHSDLGEEDSTASVKASGVKKSSRFVSRVIGSASDEGEGDMHEPSAAAELSAELVATLASAARRWRKMEPVPDMSVVLRMLKGCTLDGSFSFERGSAWALGCMRLVMRDNPRVNERLLVDQLKLGRVGGGIADACTASQLNLMRTLISRGVDGTDLADFLLARSAPVGMLPGEVDEEALEEERRLFASAHGLPEDLIPALERLVTELLMPTASNVHTLRTSEAALKEENARLRIDLNQVTHQMKEQLAHDSAMDQARRRLAEIKTAPTKTPLEVFMEDNVLDKSEYFTGLGSGPNVPSCLRTNDRVRRKQMAKRDCEKIIKEIWAHKLADQTAHGKKHLTEFVFHYFKRKYGVQGLIVEQSYNLLQALHTFRYDADCNIFLKVFIGDVDEEVYLNQVALIDDVKRLFVMVDVAVHDGQEKGYCTYDELCTSLAAFCFRKTTERINQLTRALQLDLNTMEGLSLGEAKGGGGARIAYSLLFEEDDDANESNFVERLRDQYLVERLEFFNSIEEHLYEGTSYNEECSRNHLTRAIRLTDQAIKEETLAKLVRAAFPHNAATTTVAQCMARLRRCGMNLSAAEKGGGGGGEMQGEAQGLVARAVMQKFKSARSSFNSDGGGGSGGGGGGSGGASSSALGANKKLSKADAERTIQDSAKAAAAAVRRATNPRNSGSSSASSAAGAAAGELNLNALNLDSTPQQEAAAAAARRGQRRPTLLNAISAVHIAQREDDLLKQQDKEQRNKQALAATLEEPENEEPEAA